MKKMLIVLACLLLAPLGSVAKQPVTLAGSILTMRVDGQITVDREGGVLAYEITTDIPAELQELLGTAVRKWRFHPVVVDGQPVIARNTMRITLAARQQATGYAVSVDNVTFRPATPSTTDGQSPTVGDDKRIRVSTKAMTSPRYPLGLRKAGVEGAVLLYIRISPDGRVEDVAAVQSSLYDVRGTKRLIDGAREQFENSAVAAARHWTFDVAFKGPASTLDASELTVSVPVWYMIEDSKGDAPGQWRVEFRSEKTPASWLVDARYAQDIGVSDVDQDDVMPLASALRAPDGVIGRTL